VAHREVADAIVADQGIEHVFGLPGTTIMEVLDALAGHDRIRYLSVRHEQVAAHMADGYFRAAGRPAVALASRGPGAANMTIGVHNAYAESVPVIAIVGQVPDALAGREAFEEMDLVSFFAPLTKWACEVHQADRVAELAARAVHASVAGRPRPVLLSVPLDVLQASTVSPRRRDRASAAGVVPQLSALTRAADLLRDAERPAIIVGGGLQGADHDRATERVAEALAAPVVTAWLRKGAFPNDHGAYVGTLGFGAHAAALRAVSEADVVLALGCRFSEFTTNRYELLAPSTRILHAEIDPDEIGRVYPAEVALVGDARATSAALATLLDGETPRSPARLEDLRASYRQQTSRIDPTGGDGPGVSSQAIVFALRDVLRSPDTVLVQDAHSFGPWVARHVEFTRPGSYFAAAGGAMGWGLPAAMGIQIAQPDKRVIAVCGDGSFWMVAQDLETAVREDLPVIFVITNNFAFGNTRDRQRFAHDGRYLGVFYGNPDFAAFATLLGAHGERVEDADDLPRALDRALASGRPAVIDVIQDPYEGLPSDLRPPAAR